MYSLFHWVPVHPCVGWALIELIHSNDSSQNCVIFNHSRNLQNYVVVQIVMALQHMHTTHRGWVGSLCVYIAANNGFGPNV